MDVFSLLSYINKVSLLAFFVTTLVVGYQIYILKREKSKEHTPTIPDFKEKNNFNVVANFTSLPSSLTKKELKAVNYSKPIFIIISLLTIIIVIFVVSLIKKNSSTTNQALVNPPAVISQTPIHKSITPTTKAVQLTPIVPTVIPTVESIAVLSPSVTVVPTEIVLAKSPSLTPVVNPTEVVENKPQVLPKTGSWEKGFLIIGVAISTIFFSFLL